MTTVTENLSDGVNVAIRKYIAGQKAEYLNEPTYVELLGHVQEVEKRVHSDWWSELTGCLDDQESFELWRQETYYGRIERELVRLLEKADQEDPLETAVEVLPQTLKDFEIWHARPLGDLERECLEQLERFVEGIPLEEIQSALSEWFWYMTGKGIAAYAIGVGEQTVPVELVLDRLENCTDVIGKDWGVYGLTPDSTYADAVKYARLALDGDLPEKPRKQRLLRRDLDDFFGLKPCREHSGPDAREIAYASPTGVELFSLKLRCSESGWRVAEVKETKLLGELIEWQKKFDEEVGDKAHLSETGSGGGEW